ncbi:MAG TPA: hypothetical protein VJM08_11155 [Anaerolineales bacterium]|nr:hypothetical protein [Anaerolineales bacterium]
MKDWTPIQERYLRDAVPIRLGGLAANLRRIKSFATQEAGREAVASLIEESKHFIEWTARDAQVETAAQLVELQVQLARWQQRWPQIWLDSVQRQQIAEQSSAWSDQVLKLSGLLK